MDTSLKSKVTQAVAAVVERIDRQAVRKLLDEICDSDEMERLHGERDKVQAEIDAHPLTKLQRRKAELDREIQQRSICNATSEGPGHRAIVNLRRDARLNITGFEELQRSVVSALEGEQDKYRNASYANDKKRSEGETYANETLNQALAKAQHADLEVDPMATLRTIVKDYELTLKSEVKNAGRDW